ncbi:UPF0058 family protein [Candidatus Alkanophaga liquidiphilum]|nr:putative metal-binding protein [Candidatus Alkanophaga liquidiphilum]RLG38450.1 MAG: metal-binding protein [Candidatus Alkanophagales archaeon]
MKKEELIHLHLLLAQIKKYFEENGLDNGFTQYKELGISPFHIHRSKSDHKRAIFTLGNELASMIAKDEFSESYRTAERMKEFARRTA